MNLGEPEKDAAGGARPETAPDSFFPRGAIFFFILLLALYGVIWLVIYFLMIARS